MSSPFLEGDVSGSLAPVSSTAQRRLPHLGQNWTPSRKPQPEDGEPQDSPEAQWREGRSARPAGVKGAELPWAQSPALSSPLPPELNALQEELEPHGLVILGFPSNQFGKQEPGENSEILAIIK